jgi:hypothetical protein
MNMKRSLRVRRITIKTPSSSRYDFTMPYEYSDDYNTDTDTNTNTSDTKDGLTDSEALHQMLCNIDAESIGDEYVVVFTEVTLLEVTEEDLYEIVYTEHSTPNNTTPTSTPNNTFKP